MAASSDNADYVHLGRIATDAPEAAVLLALRQLRPQCDVRLNASGIEPDGTKRYELALRAEPWLSDNGMIDVWLRIKSALLAAFPADKPHAVRTLD